MVHGKPIFSHILRSVSDKNYRSHCLEETLIFTKSGKFIGKIRLTSNLQCLTSVALLQERWSNQILNNNIFKQVINPVSVFREVTMEKGGKNTKVSLFWSITKSKAVWEDSWYNLSTCLCPLPSGRGISNNGLLVMFSIQYSM